MSKSSSGPTSGSRPGIRADNPAPTEDELRVSHESEVHEHELELELHNDGTGRGTEVEIARPLVSPPPAPVLPKLPNVSRRRVLVIEDHPEAAQSLATALRVLGHDPEVAGDGRTALAAAYEFHPEIVLCDIALPGMNGYEIARAFRGDPDLRGMFLVALSGYAQSDDVRRTTEAGFDRHVAKPVDIETLLRVLAEASEDSRRPR